MVTFKSHCKSCGFKFLDPIFEPGSERIRDKMATVDSSLYYSLALGTIFTAAYVLTNINFETISTKISSVFQKLRKDALQETLPTPEEGKAETSTSDPKISPTWWTSEEIFQLERRAIFSKVSNMLLDSLFSTLTN